MRICFITQNLSQFLNTPGQVTGGAEKQMQLLAKGLSKYGIETTFIVSGCENNGVMESELGILHLIEKQKTSKIPWIPALFYWLKLIRKMKEAKADVYYVRSASPALFVIAGWCRLHNKKAVFSASCDLDSQAKSPTCNKPIQRILFKLGLMMCERVLAQHDGQINNFEKILNVDAVSVENCIEIPSIQEQENTNERNILLFLGRLDYLKRPDVFIETAKRLPQYQFVLAGGWDNENKTDYISSVLESARSCKNIKLHGNVSQQEVQNLLKKTALLINTSDAEGFPNTFLEAWCREVPVVSLNIDPGGIMEEYNLVPATKSIEKLVETIDSLMRNPQERIRVGRLSRKCAEENFSIEDITDKFLSVTECNR